ncbi:carbohydrate binding-domain-containing protein [Delphinella strobiligena]|nr:carbohydrate binding-domain-containing protein [Delphinella strobiligena]
MTLIIFVFFAIVAFVVGANAVPTFHHRDVDPCGGSWYNASQYDCLPNNQLCPIINGESSKECGSACYSEYQYTCTDNALATLPPANGPFTLTASNPTAPFHGQSIQASNMHFLIGIPGPNTYCPAPVVPIEVCEALAGTNTSLTTTSLAVAVPGGQQTYWMTDGSLSFTIAHSASTYNLSAYGSVAYASGAYLGPNGEGLVACPTASPVFSDRASRDANATTPVWKVFARLAGLSFASDCVDFYAVVNEEDEGVLSAWEFF